MTSRILKASRQQRNFRRRSREQRRKNSRRRKPKQRQKMLLKVPVTEVLTTRTEATGTRAGTSNGISVLPRWIRFLELPVPRGWPESMRHRTPAPGLSGRSLILVWLMCWMRKMAFITSSPGMHGALSRRKTCQWETTRMKR